jgi:hypothetical protein
VAHLSQDCLKKQNISIVIKNKQPCEEQSRGASLARPSEKKQNIFNVIKNKRPCEEQSRGASLARLSEKTKHILNANIVSMQSTRRELANNLQETGKNERSPRNSADPFAISETTSAATNFKL